MSDPRKLIEALTALVSALPGAPNHVHVSLHGCMALQDFVAAFDAKTKRYQNDAATEEWDHAEVRAAVVTISAFGPHRPIVSYPVNEEAVDRALAVAAEALSS